MHDDFNIFSSLLWLSTIGAWIILFDRQENRAWRLLCAAICLIQGCLVIGVWRAVS